MATELPLPPSGEAWFNPYGWTQDQFGEGYLPVLESQVDTEIEAGVAEYNTGTEQEPTWTASEFPLVPSREASGVLRVPASIYGPVAPDDSPVDINRLLARARPVPVVAQGYDFLGSRFDMNIPPLKKVSARSLDSVSQANLAHHLIQSWVLGQVPAAMIEQVNTFMQSIVTLAESLTPAANDDAGKIYKLLSAR